jgi:hypothetical protein
MNAPVEEAKNVKGGKGGKAAAATAETTLLIRKIWSLMMSARTTLFWETPLSKSLSSTTRLVQD